MSTAASVHGYPGQPVFTAASAHGYPGQPAGGSPRFLQSSNVAADFSPRSSGLCRNLLFSEHRLVQLGQHNWNGPAPTSLPLLETEILGRAKFHPFTSQELDAGLWYGHRLSELSRQALSSRADRSSREIFVLEESRCPQGNSATRAKALDASQFS